MVMRGEVLPCHNSTCTHLFVKRRRTQIHCSRLCGERCRLCHRPHEQSYEQRLKLERSTSKRGLKPRKDDVVSHPDEIARIKQALGLLLDG